MLEIWKILNLLEAVCTNMRQPDCVGGKVIHLKIEFLIHIQSLIIIHLRKEKYSLMGSVYIDLRNL